jgi:hypothetical protein
MAATHRIEGGGQAGLQRLALRREREPFGRRSTAKTEASSGQAHQRLTAAWVVSSWPAPTSRYAAPPPRRRNPFSDGSRRIGA